MQWAHTQPLEEEHLGSIVHFSETFSSGDSSLGTDHTSPWVFSLTPNKQNWKPKHSSLCLLDNMLTKPILFSLVEWFSFQCCPHGRMCIALKSVCSGVWEFGSLPSSSRYFPAHSPLQFNNNCRIPARTPPHFWRTLWRWTGAHALVLWV